MEYINKSQVWKTICDLRKVSASNYYQDSSFTKIQWEKYKEVNKIKSEALNSILKSFIGRYLKGNFLICEITENEIWADAISVIYVHDNHSENWRLIFKYDATFKSKLLSFSKGGNGVNIEGQVLDFTGNSIILQLTSIEKSACFIATACYGDYDSPEVVVLRKFRDEKLLKTRLGKFLVITYYFISPCLANFISRSVTMKRFIKKHFLAPIIKYLSQS